MTRFCLVLVLFTSLLARVSLGQSSPQPSLETVQAWFDKEWEQAQTMPDFGDCSISWALEIVYVPNAAEYRSLAQSVEARPDHPKAGLLIAYQRRLKGQFDRFGRRMWVRSNDEWRINQEFPGGHFDDYTITKRHAWRTTPLQLIVTRPEPGRVSFDNIAGIAKMFWPELTRLLDGGLSFGAISGLEPGRVRVRGNQWRVILSRPDAGHELQKFEREIVGRWDAEAGRGFVEYSTITKSAKSETIGTRVTFADWTWVETVDRWIAGRVEYFTPEGLPDRNLIFSEATCDPNFTFNKVVKVPDKERGDLVRGPIAFIRIENHRTGNIRKTNADGTFTNTAIPAEAGAPSRSWRRWLGVAVMATLAIGFVSLYLKRRSAT